MFNNCSNSNTAQNTLRYTKEILFDLMINLPYTISDSALYLLNAVNFLDMISQDDKDKWKKPQYITLLILISILTITYFCTFSESNSQLFNIEQNTVWSRIKNYTRRILGIPSAITKTSIGSASFFMSTISKLGSMPAAILSCFIWICSLPSQTAILWSNFEKATDNNISDTDPPQSQTTLNKKIIILLKYLAIHAPTILYALSNASLYFWSLLNLPKRLGILDHTIGDKDNSLETIAYYLSFIITTFPFIATYISCAHLNENMFGLIATESSSWTKIKEYTKKYTGAVASSAKVTNASTAIYSLTNSFLNKPISIGLTGLCGISGLISQMSLLYSDPLRKKNYARFPNNQMTSELENEQLIELREFTGSPQTLPNNIV